MRIDEANSCIIFDNLISADRAFGSTESISVVKPAEKAVAQNAKGGFKDRTIFEINDESMTFAKSLSAALTA